MLPIEASESAATNITAAITGFVVAVKTISITLSALGIVVKSVALTFMFLKST